MVTTAIERCQGRTNFDHALDRRNHDEHQQFICQLGGTQITLRGGMMPAKSNRGTTENTKKLQMTDVSSSPGPGWTARTQGCLRGPPRAAKAIGNYYTPRIIYREIFLIPSMGRHLVSNAAQY